MSSQVLPSRSALPPSDPLFSNLKGSFPGFRITSQRELWFHWVRRRSPETLRRCRLLFGGNNTAAIGAGLGAIDPLRVSQLCREVTSWRVSQYRTVVLDSIYAYAFPVPKFTLAFNCPNYHTVKQHRPPEQVFQPPQTPPALTQHLHLTRYASLHGKEGIYLYFSIRKSGDQLASSTNT